MPKECGDASVPTYDQYTIPTIVAQSYTERLDRFERKIDAVATKLDSTLDEIRTSIGKIQHDQLRQDSLLDKFDLRTTASLMRLESEVRKLNVLVVEGNGHPSLMQRVAVAESHLSDVRSEQRDLIGRVEQTSSRIERIDRDGSKPLLDHLQEHATEFSDSRSRWWMIGLTVAGWIVALIAAMAGWIVNALNTRP